MQAAFTVLLQAQDSQVNQSFKLYSEEKDFCKLLKLLSIDLIVS